MLWSESSLTPFRQRIPGFTIIELLVALTVTLLVLFLVSRLFFDTAGAVGQGAMLSDIIASSRMISEQLERDGANMIPPDDADPDLTGGFLVIVNQVIPTVAVRTRTDSQGLNSTRSVRSDQLVFVRSGSGLESLTPGAVNAYANDVYANPPNKPPTYARVWYGHVLRTDPDGTGPAAGGLGVGPNRIATNWVLGRQALLLTGYGFWPIFTGARATDAVQGYSSIPIALPKNYHALTDVSDWDLDNDVMGFLIAGTANDTYEDRAYQFTYCSDNERLRVNPFPYGGTFTSWQVAQTHPHLMANVSDFVVEFAADVEDDLNIAGFPDGEPDYHGGTGNLIWYPNGADMDDNPPPWNGFYTHNPTAVLGANEVRFVFRHDYADNWPYLIRVRYRLHDPLGKQEQWVGDSATGGRQSGMWFEQVIRVNRQ